MIYEAVATYVVGMLIGCLLMWAFVLGGDAVGAFDMNAEAPLWFPIGAILLVFVAPIVPAVIVGRKA